jgi:pyruvate dehydrogenase E2 component (dihydrolipoamide acetyltransferase)
MPIEIKMPQMGESITEGTVVRWLKKPGERVDRDETLFEISTDKVDTEVPSPAAGVVQSILVPEGETVPVDTPVCILAEELPAAANDGRGQEASESAARSAAAPASPVKNTVAGPAAAPPQSLGDALERLSPAVRRLAREQGVDLSRIRGSGEGGRITRQDVLDHLAARGPAAPSPAAAAPALEARVEPLSHLRRKIAENMVQAKRTAPHVTTVHEVDLSPVAALRKRLAPEYEARGEKITYLPFVVQAAAAALRQSPALNASLIGEHVHYHAEINIGVAVALDEGLIVPVIRRADTLSIRELARAVGDLSSRARQKKLQAEEVQHGTFTITNPGLFGTLIATPIIPQPQVAILCLGAAQKRVVVLPESDAIAIRTMAYLSLSFDHRLIDGAVADRFLVALKKGLQEGEFRLEA